MAVAMQQPKHILVVDDEAAIRVVLRECLELEGFRVSEAADGHQLDALFAQSPADLVTLDVNLGGENGFDIARRLRGRHNVPIVMISGKGDLIDRVVGLELGADDYITKPFHLREVIARVRAVIRRYDGGETAARNDAKSALLAFEDWVLDPGARELRSRAGAAQDLTTAEFDLLHVLLQRPGRVLSRDNLMDLLKGHDWSPLDRSIDSLMVRLRRKIERDPAAPRLIKTVRGIGYVFSGQVARG
jgi:DNA-binding response OmpR family regulator